MAYPVQRRLTRVSGLYGPRKPIALGGGKFSPSFHGGVDFTPLNRGTRVPTYAVGRGVVTGINLGGGAAGWNVMIRLDGDGSYWWYGHLSRIDVAKGQRVVDGQQLGLIGATGNTTGVHLHLERHWPRIDAETDPWPHIKDERDVEGLTSSWQTGNPPVAIGDAQDIEEDDMFTEADRKTAANTQTAVGNIATRMWTANRDLVVLRAKVDGLEKAIADQPRDQDPDVIASAVVEALGKDAAKIVADRLIVRIDAQ